MKKIIMVVAAVMLVAAIIIVGSMRNEVEINADSVLPATEESGWINEKIIGDADAAKVVIFEYADFGCSHCAEQNKVVNELVQKYGNDFNNNNSSNSNSDNEDNNLKEEKPKNQVKQKWPLFGERLIDGDINKEIYEYILSNHKKSNRCLLSILFPSQYALEKEKEDNDDDNNKNKLIKIPEEKKKEKLSFI